MHIGGGQKKVESVIIDSKKSASNENQLFKSPQTMKSALMHQTSYKYSLKHQIACGPAGPAAAIESTTNREGGPQNRGSQFNINLITNIFNSAAKNTPKENKE